MTRGFWSKLAKPILILAPMYDVTDAAFRKIIATYGKPDVFFTEFVSANGLSSAGRDKLMHHLWFNKIEHPIVAQIFGADPEKFTETAKLCADLGFDGIDINMGCPDKNIMKSGSCAALFNKPELAQEIIRATKAGAGDLPVSCKIRIGDTQIDWQPWISAILKAEPAVITVHLRTRKEMSKVPAHWELMAEIVKFIDDNTTEDTRPLVIGNGDIATPSEAREKAKETGCDGIMIGRGIFGNPWLFDESKPNPTKQEKLAVLKEHVQLYDELYTGIKPFDIMKRHFKAYIHGFNGAAELRAKLYDCKNVEEICAVIDEQK